MRVIHEEDGEFSLSTTESFEYIKQFEDKIVTIYVSNADDKREFAAGIFVQGILELNAIKKQFRVLNNNGTYGYFKAEDCVRMSVRLSELYDKSIAVIKLKIE